MYLSMSSSLEATYENSWGLISTKFICQEFSTGHTVINMNVRAFRHAVGFTLIAALCGTVYIDNDCDWYSYIKKCHTHKQNHLLSLLFPCTLRHCSPLHPHLYLHYY